MRVKAERTMRVVRPSPLHSYVGAVAAIGLGALGVVGVVAAPAAIRAATPFAWLVAALLVAGELRPVVIPFRAEAQEVSTSSAFVFALLLISGLGLAAPVQAIATILADARTRRGWWKIAFNVGQLVIALVMANLVLHLLVRSGDLDSGRLAWSSVVGLLAGAATYFVVNNTLVAIAIAFAGGTSVRAVLLSDMVFQASTAAVLLTLAPLIVVAGRDSMLFVPFFAPAMFAVYRSARMSVEKEHQAGHDALTGLPNRTKFRERVDAAIREAHGRARLALLLIDLDYFKDVNDTLGHHIGDLLLCGIGARLRDAVGRKGSVARLGGDEFAVLIPTNDRDEVRMLADAVLHELREPFALNELTFQIEASIGAVLCPEDADDTDQLLQRADVAMYIAKQRRSGYETYNAELDRHTAKRLTLLGELRRAIGEAQLVLHYQPTAELQSGTVTGVECLVRWQHPTHGLVMPDEFIPLAEPTGVIAPLTLYVLDRALSQCRMWRDIDLELRVAVNVSVRNLYDAEFPEAVASLLAAHDIAAGSLDLEITESAVMADPRRAIAVLQQLSDMGVGLALDDFGTGYSSLAHLKRLPVDKIKIDRSFVINMASDEEDAAIVASTIDLARSLGLQVVAEGVETERSWRRLRELGCHAAQGYYLSRPLPPAQLLTWLRMSAPDDGFARLQPVRPLVARRSKRVLA